MHSVKALISYFIPISKKAPLQSSQEQNLNITQSLMKAPTATSSVSPPNSAGAPLSTKEGRKRPDPSK